MIKVGFILNFSLEYKGGINYIKNLFYAINQFYKDEVQIIFFVPDSLPQEYISIFGELSTIVKTPIVERKTLPWLVSRLGERLLKFDLLTYLLLKRYKIDVVSHSNYVFPGKRIKSVNWIPDFQSLHYPHLWTKKQLNEERKLHLDLVKKSDVVVVSSNDALKDLKSIYPGFDQKVRVLHFVSQPDILKFNTPVDVTKYADRPFFYLPNQFWEHKNHQVVFKAVKMLKDQGIDILLLTSGLMNDFRSKNLHIEGLRNYVKENGLTENIKFLGLIPYPDVLQLIKNSIAVINPSFFEGWSSTVEESKSIGKSIILSDIPVHREQNPENSFFFNPENGAELADILNKLSNKLPAIDSGDLEKESIGKLNTRTKAFASNYVGMIKELL